MKRLILGVAAVLAMAMPLSTLQAADMAVKAPPASTPAASDWTGLYVDVGVGWQHWFSPQVEIRPEVTWYHSMDQAAFDNGTSHKLWFAGGDVIWHF